MIYSKFGTPTLGEPRKYVCVSAIRLRKSGNRTVVDAEIGGEFVEVISELSDNEFCHIVEYGGLMKAAGL